PASSTAIVSMTHLAEAVFPVNVQQHKERAPCPAAPPSSCLRPRKHNTCTPSLTPAPAHKAWPSVPAWSCCVPNPAPRKTGTWRPNSAAIPTGSASGVGASPNTAWTACTTARVVAARPLFPPEDRHKVVVLATQDPADAGVPISHWSLTDLATK